MKKYLLFPLVLMVLNAGASWYWPFGSAEEEGDDRPRLRFSELMEPASVLIDEAADLAIDGNSQEAIGKYRAALAELERIERENPDRVETPEFATLRNKRAYVNAAIDSLLMAQVQQNARAVAVSDTTELEKRLAAERGGKAAGAGDDKAAGAGDDKASAGAKTGEDRKSGEAARSAEKKPERAEKKPSGSVKDAAKSQREQAMADIEAGDYDSAMLVIESMLVEKPNSAAALNLKARVESARGRLREAEAALDQAIMSNPRGYHAYFNMARLMLAKDPPNISGAKRYYETGRTVGGPEDPELEARFK